MNERLKQMWLGGLTPMGGRPASAGLGALRPGHTDLTICRTLERHPLDELASADTSGTLTERQLEVLRLVGSGEPNKSVARRLGLEEQTVKGHLTAIFKALGTVNRVQAIQAARAAGLLP